MPFMMIGAAISGGASLLGGLFQADAASSAADKQAAAARDAAAATQAQYDQTRADLAPYRTAGQTALNKLMPWLNDLTAGYGTTFSWNPTMAQIEATPGYQFTRAQGLKAVQNSASARGLGVSGAAMRAAADYSTGLANNTWKDLFNTDLTTYNTNFTVDQANKANAYNKLLGVIGAGQSSAAQTGAFGQQATANAGNYLTSGANAQASGDVGSAKAISSGFNNAAAAGMQGVLLNKLYGGDAAGAGGLKGYY